MATVNYHLSILSKIFSLAVDAELIDSNPSARVGKFRLNNGRTRVLSKEEETKLFSALEGNEIVRQIITVAIHTGMRRNEIFSLKWFDVDFNRGVFQVRESKSGRSRSVPMNSTVRTLLSGIRRQSEYVFPSPKTGGKLTDIKRSFHRGLKQAEIENFCFHDLRHTAATRMADSGADAFTMAKILGHSDIRITHRYTHATNSAIRRAVENLDENSDFGNESATEAKSKRRDFP